MLSFRFSVILCKGILSVTPGGSLTIIHIIVYTANIMNVNKSESDAVGYGIMKYPDSPQHQTKQVVKIQAVWKGTQVRLYLLQI